MVAPAFAKSLLKNLSIVLFVLAGSVYGVPFDEIGGLVSMEAENFDLKASQGSGQDWQLRTTPTNASGGNLMQARPINGINIDTGFESTSPQMDFDINFTTTGTYYVWVRGHAQGSSGKDSVHTGLDGVSTNSNGLRFTSTNAWTWKNTRAAGVIATINVATAGVHTFNVWMREDGFNIDKIVLSNDANFSLAGDGSVGPAESARGGSSNNAPILTPIGNQSATEGVPLTVNLSATDSDGPAPLTLSQTNTLPGSPNILTDNGSGSGTLQWTPAIGDAAGSPYSVTVKATDGSGASTQETISISVSAPSGGSAFQESGGQVTMEAENFDVKASQNSGQDWQLRTTPTGASGGNLMQARPINGINIKTGFESTSPQMDFEINFTTTGTYYVWVRGHAQGSSGKDSVHTGLDGVSTNSNGLRFTSTNAWTWKNTRAAGAIATINVATAGVHTFNVWMREDGFNIDKIVLSNDVNFSLTGDGSGGPAESPRGSGGGGSAPATPTNLIVTGVSSTQINLSWTDTALETSYNIRRRILGNSIWNNPVSAVANTTTYPDTSGLVANTTYEYQIRATNAVGSSAYSVTKTATTQASGGGGALAFIEVAGQVSMEAESYDANTPQAGHTWDLKTIPTGASDTQSMQALPINGTLNSTGFETLSPRLDYSVNFTTAGTYYVWVRGHANGSSGADSVHVGIDNNSTNSSNMKYIPVGPNAWTWLGSRTSTSERSTITVSAGVHTINVWMREDGFLIDKIVLSTSSTFTPNSSGPVESQRGTGTADTLAPNVPPNLTAVATSTTQISVNWGVSTENGGGVVAGYRLFRNGALIQDLNSLSRADNNLTPDTPYTYYVVAYDDSANVSVQSGPKTATTFPIPVVPANGLTANQISGGVRLNWNNPSSSLVTIYARSNSTWNGNVIGTSTGTSFDHTTTNSGLTMSDKTRYYWITSPDAAGTIIRYQNSDTSTISATGGASTSNQPPIANAGSDQLTVQEGQSVSLDGSATSDPDNLSSELSYAWSPTAGTTGTGWSLSSPNVAQPTFTAPTGLSADLFITFTLTASDPGLLSSTDTVNIIVQSAAPTALGTPILSAPVNNTSINYGISEPCFSWQVVPGAASYTLEVGKTSDITATNWTMSNISAGTTMKCWNAGAGFTNGGVTQEDASNFQESGTKSWRVTALPVDTNLTQSVSATETFTLTNLPGDLAMLSHIATATPIEVSSLAGSQAFSAGVNPARGDALIDLPIQTPPGINGVQPALSISYNSGGGKDLVELNDTAGVLGYGWSLSGISQIQRCRVGIGGVVVMDTSDQLCIDGERLIEISAAGYWADNAEYRTESQSFLKIKAKGAGLANRWFEVQTPQGRTLDYGNAAKSTYLSTDGNATPYVWPMTKEVDEFSNTLTITYERSVDFTASYPISINYGALGNSNSVDFYYAIRPDAVQATIAPIGSEMITTYVALNKIVVQISGSTAREYRLENSDLNGAYTLSRIQQCGYDEFGSIEGCLPATSFAWQVFSAAQSEIKFAVMQATNGFGGNTEFLYELVDGQAPGPALPLLDFPVSEVPGGWFGTDTGTLPLNAVLHAVTDQRLVVSEMITPTGLSGVNVSTSTTYEYRGFPLYDSFGRGYLGFPASKEIRNNVAIINGSETASLDTQIKTYRQHRLDFPFIGRAAREVSEVRRGSTWYQLPLREIRWAKKSINFSAGGTSITFPYVERTHEEVFERTGTNQQATQAAIQVQFMYCFAALSGDTCPAGTPLEYPTQLKSQTRQLSGFSNGPQSPGIWGDVGVRSPNATLRFKESTANYTNTVSVGNWTLGFVDKFQLGFGVNSVSESYANLFSKKQANSLLVADVTQFEGDIKYALSSSTNYLPQGQVSSVNVSGVDVVQRTNALSNYAEGLYPQSMDNAKLQPTNLNYDLRFGKPKSITDANGQNATLIYDALGRVTRQTLADNTLIDFTYADCASGCSQITWANPKLKISKTVTHGFTQTAPNTWTYLDARGQVVLTETESFSGSNRYRVETHRYSDGRVAQQSLPYQAGQTPKYVKFHYDEKARLVLTQRPDGANTTNSYAGSAGQLQLTVTDSSTGQQKRLTFNALSELSEVIDGFGSIDAVTTTYTYTFRGFLDVVTVAGVQVADMDYDIAGNRIQITEPASGTTIFQYDALNQLRYSTDQKDQKTKFTYDVLGRLTQRIDGDLGSNAITNIWNWDGAINGAGLLNLRSAAKSGATYFTETYAYDTTSRLQSQTATLALSGAPVVNNAYTTSYLYAQGRLASVTNPDNIILSQSYTARGFRSSVDFAGTALQTNTTMNAFGNIIDTGFGNGLQTQRGYDANSGRLTSVQTGTAAASKSIQDLEYQWRADSTLLKRIDHQNTGTLSDDKTDTFSYDALNRLVSVTSSKVSGPNRTKAYDHDDFGNLLFSTSTIAGDNKVENYAYTTPGKPYTLTSATINNASTNFIHDDNGNITQYQASSAGTTYIDYDAADRAQKITVGSSSTTTTPNARDEFWYGPDGARIARKSTWEDSGQKTSWVAYINGGAFERVYPQHDSNTDYVSKVQATSSVLVRFVKPSGSTGTPVVDYLHRDHLGSIDSITDTNGNELRNLSFDPFGSRRDADWSSDILPLDLDTFKSDLDLYTPRGFTGHEHLDRTGIIHMNGRIYDPRIGRFLQHDPFVPDPTNSQSFNRYAYVTNSPLSFTDPSGYGPSDVTSHLNLGIFRPSPVLVLTLGTPNAFKSPRSFGEPGNGSGAGSPVSATGGSGVVIASQSLFVNSFTAEDIVDIGVEFIPGIDLLRCAFIEQCSTEDWVEAAVIAGVEIAGGLVLGKAAVKVYKVFRASKVAKAIGKEIGILRDAAKGKGNFGLGSGSRVEADKLGKAFVGDGARVASDGKSLVSRDGLRVYRPPSAKPNSTQAKTGVQANFERKIEAGGRPIGNGHLDIVD